MVRAELISDLKRDEGYAKALPNGDCQAYPDPLTKADPWTIGYGHTGLDVHPRVQWTRAKAEAVLIADIERHNAELLRKAPWIAKLDPVRQDALFNMAFNLGVEGLLQFKNTLAAIKAGNYVGGADGMLQSLWARQVGNRAARLAHMIRFGTR